MLYFDLFTENQIISVEGGLGHKYKYIIYTDSFDYEI